MNKHKTTHLIQILGGAAVLLVMIFGWLLWLFLSSSEYKQEPARETSVPSTPDTSLTMKEDLGPDRSKLYTAYDALLIDLDGNALQLSDFRGSPVVLFFWSSWCKDCEAYIKSGIQEAKKAAESEGARFLLVCREGLREETAESARNSMAEYGLSEEIYMDAQAALFKRLGLRSVPSFAFLSADGTLLLSTDKKLTVEEMKSYVQYAKGEMLDQTAAFFQNTLMDEKGGIASSYTPDSLGRAALSGVRMAETQGLMMEYALETSDKELFESVYSYVNTFLTQNGLCAWRSVEGEIEAVNASLDDLRVLQALLIAQERWGGYEQDIALREQALWLAVVQDGFFLDFANLDGNEQAQTSTLCYLDVSAFETLVKYSDRWQAVAEKAEKILEDGIISQAFPLYYPRYDIAGRRYTGSELQMNEAMVCVLHCARAGIVQDKTLDYLESLLSQGPVYAAYGADGIPLSGYRFESTATYALLVQIGLETGREGIVRPALSRMESARCLNGFMKGGYGLVYGTTHYTFDDLQALKAWSLIKLASADKK